MDRGMEMGQDGGPSGAAPLRDASRREIRLKRLMAFFMQEIQDSRNPIRSDTDMPDHECGFLTKPETGYCAFCDSWGEAFEALSAEAAGLPEPAPGEGSPSHPSGPSQDSQEVRVAIGDILTDVYHGQINPARAIDRILALSQSPKGPQLDVVVSEAVPPGTIGFIQDGKLTGAITNIGQSPKGAAGARECWVMWPHNVEVAAMQAIADEPTHKRGSTWEWVRMVEAPTPSPTTAGGPEPIADRLLRDFLASAKTVREGEEWATEVDMEKFLSAHESAAHYLEQKRSVGGDGPSAPKTGLRGADALGVVESVLAEMDRFSEKVLSGKVSDEEIGGMAPVIIDTWRTKLRAQGDAARGDAAAGWDSNQAAQALAARVQDLETRLLHAIEALDVFTAREFTGTILNRMKGWKGMNYLREPFEETTPEPAPGDVGSAGGDKA